MRVIAGDFKGRNLKAPTGMDTRPTTDRVKESFISSLISAYGSLEGAHVLDAFAGSGALGIECLSRGAESAVFFERDTAALEALRKPRAAEIQRLCIGRERARFEAVLHRQRRECAVEKRQVHIKLAAGGKQDFAPDIGPSFGLHGRASLQIECFCASARL